MLELADLPSSFMDLVDHALLLAFRWSYLRCPSSISLNL